MRDSVAMMRGNVCVQPILLDCLSITAMYMYVRVQGIIVVTSYIVSE